MVVNYNPKLSSKEALHRTIAMKRRDYDHRLVDLMSIDAFAFYSRYKDEMKVEIGKDNKITIEYGFRIFNEEQFDEYLAKCNYFHKNLTERVITDSF